MCLPMISLILSEMLTNDCHITSDTSLHMIAMIDTALSKLLTHDCLELLTEYPAGLWLFHTPSLHQSAEAKNTKKIVYINKIKNNLFSVLYEIQYHSR